MAIGLGTTQGNITTAIPQPEPSGYKPIGYRIETFRRLANGEGTKDITANVGRWEISWYMLTYVEWATLKAYWDVQAPLWFRDIEGADWKVIVTGEFPSPVTPVANGAHRYAASMTLEWAGNNDPTGLFVIGTSTIGSTDTIATA